MKKAKFFKFKCFLVALIMVALCATTAFAVPGEYVENASGHIDHPNSENCIYSCVLDTFEAPAVQSEAAFAAPYESAEAIDEQIYAIHADCIYSCEHTPSLSEQLSGNPESKEISLIDEEMTDFIAKMYGVPVENIDLDWVSEPVVPLTNEEVENLISEILSAFPEMSEDIIEQQSTSACSHSIYVNGGCVGNHISSSGCTTICVIDLTCFYCGHSSKTSTTHEAHSWSVGWCGQTCKVCGKVDTPFHAPGGCYYCR